MFMCKGCSFRYEFQGFPFKAEVWSLIVSSQRDDNFQTQILATERTSWYLMFFHPQATLEMKGVKEMKALLDILELDSSGYVRIQVTLSTLCFLYHRVFPKYASNLCDMHALSGKQDTVTEFGLCFLPSYYAKMSENHQCVGYHNNKLKIWSPVEKLFSVPQVVRAFGLMEWSDPRILRSLKEREKGEGALAK